MVGKSIVSYGRPQRAVVIYIKRSRVNETADFSECVRSVNYASCYKHNFIGLARPFTISELREKIREGIPMMVIGYYPNSVYSHAVVIYGTQFQDYNAIITTYVNYIDPYDGTRHTCTMEDFLDGSYNGRMYGSTITTMD